MYYNTLIKSNALSWTPCSFKKEPRLSSLRSYNIYKNIRIFTSPRLKLYTISYTNWQIYSKQINPSLYKYTLFQFCNE